MVFPNQQQHQARARLIPLRAQPIGPRLVAPYKTGPWCAGTMVTFAFLVLPIMAVLVADRTGNILASGFAGASEDAKNGLFGSLALAGVPTLYLCIASLINVARFAAMRQQVQSHYAALLPVSGRDPHLDHDVAGVLRDDGELYRDDRRRHVLRIIGAVFGVIASILSLFDGSTTATSSGEPETRGPRAGQFAYKLFWGIVVLAGGGAAIYFLDKDSPQVYAEIGVYVAITVIWWLPSLWRSVALRRVDAAWRDGAASVYARLPMPAPGWCAPRG